MAKGPNPKIWSTDLVYLNTNGLQPSQTATNRHQRKIIQPPWPPCSECIELWELRELPDQDFLVQATHQSAASVQAVRSPIEALGPAMQSVDQLVWDEPMEQPQHHLHPWQDKEFQIHIYIYMYYYIIMCIYIYILCIMNLYFLYTYIHVCFHMFCPGRITTWHMKVVQKAIRRWLRDQLAYYPADFWGT